MKRIRLLLLCILLTLSMAGCEEQSESTSNPAPEEFLEADIFFHDGVVWENAADIDWVAALDLPEGDEIGVIQRSGITGDWQEWDATVLPEGTAILKHAHREDILIALQNGLLTPYLKIVEG